MPQTSKSNRTRQQHAALVLASKQWNAEPFRHSIFTEGTNYRSDHSSYCLLWTCPASSGEPGWYWSSDASDLDAVLGFDEPDSLHGPYHTIEAAGEAALAGDE